ncbi:hypothetical protein SLA2020_490400 [Shorea laevis]|uniref:Uncharacterized protein n=1 Tax=Rubroshorea leprosula TaxID=152421 RepID=A0AAV5MTM3_9ROSI|nr:hypothetical protein SLEP1_g59873 [Rubroshorea leprosula]
MGDPVPVPYASRSFRRVVGNRSRRLFSSQGISGASRSMQSPFCSMSYNIPESVDVVLRPFSSGIKFREPEPVVGVIR